MVTSVGGFSLFFFSFVGFFLLLLQPFLIGCVMRLSFSLFSLNGFLFLFGGVRFCLLGGSGVVVFSGGMIEVGLDIGTKVYRASKIDKVVKE